MTATAQLSNPPERGKKKPEALLFLKKSHRNNDGS